LQDERQHHDPDIQKDLHDLGVRKRELCLIDEL
jgi:hypothetical protein